MTSWISTLNFWDSVKLYEYAIFVNFGVNEKIPFDVTIIWYPLDKVFDLGYSRSLKLLVLQSEYISFNIKHKI